MFNRHLPLHGPSSSSSWCSCPASNTLLMSMFERTREIGTMLANGHAPRLDRPPCSCWKQPCSGIMGALVGVAAGNLLGMLLNSSGLHMPPPPGYTVAIPIQGSSCARPDDRLVAAGDRLAGVRIHPAGGPRIPAANSGGIGPCLTLTHRASTAYCAPSCCSCSLASCSPACWSATPQRPIAEALLKRSDTYRNGWPAYVVHVKITTFESNKADEERLYEVSQKGLERTYVEFMSPRDKGRHLLIAGRRYVDLSARHQPPGAHHAARTALGRRLQRRHRPHQLCGRLFPRLSTHREGGRGRLQRARTHRQAQRLDLPKDRILVAPFRMPAR